MNSSMKLMHTFLLAFLLAGCDSQPVAHAKQITPANTAALSPQRYQAMLGKGMDVDWAKTKQGIHFYTGKTPADFKARGVRHVRIRVADDAAPAMLAHLQRVVDDSLRSGLIPILAYQGGPLERDPLNPADQQAFLAWWQAVAERFKGYPPELAFNLIIEVSDKLKKHPNVLNAIYAKAIPLIRQTHPNRILIASPGRLSAPEALADLRLPQDKHLMVEWHFYAAGPSRTNQKKLWTDGNPAEQQLIRDKIALGKAWQESNRIPTWVGAWMANNFNEYENRGAGDYSIPEQVEFSRFVASELDKAGIPFAVNSDTKFYDRETGQWIAEQQPVLDAILRPERGRK